MRWMLAAAAVAALSIAGCGVRNSVAPPASPVVGSYLGDADAVITTGGKPELVANIGFVVRADGTVEGAAFTSAPVANYDIFFTGAVNASGQLQASGSMVGGDGTQPAGSFTMTGAFTTFGVAPITGTFTADNVGTGTWRAYFYSALTPLGCYMGTYTGGRSGIIAIMNFPAAPPDYPADTVVMIKENGQPHTDSLYGLTADVLTPLPPPIPPDREYALLMDADSSFYGTGLRVEGTLGGTSASGAWSQPQDSTPLTGAWSASRPDSRAATRATTTGPLRVRRVKHKSRSSPVAGHS
jgi:hypothetical protein